MHFFAVILAVVAAIGITTSTIFLALTIAGACKFFREAARQKRFAESLTDDQLPFVSLLKPMHGLEPQLEENFESFFLVDYPRYEVIFACDHEDDPAIAVANRVRARHPQIPAQIVVNGEPPWPNRQDFALYSAAQAAKSDILVTSDSDVIVTRNYLREVVPPMLDSKNGALTCVYRGLATGGFWSLMDAIGMSVEMTAGVLVANLLEGMKFALSPTLVLNRQAHESMGGYTATGYYFSHDFIIGNRIAKNGYNVVLSRHAIAHVVPHMGFKKMWQHLVRWAAGTRRSRPLGHLGTGLIFSVPYGILALIAGCLLGYPGIGAVVFAWSIVNRMIESLLVGWGITHDPPCLYRPWLYPIRDLIGFAVWVASYTSTQLAWRERSFELLSDGRISVHGSKPGDVAPR
jgi:ceramide glucosyltransferase